MKTIKAILAAFLIIATQITCAQDAAGAKDLADYKRIAKQYDIYEYKELKGTFDIILSYDEENKTTVAGTLKDYDYLNFDNKTFATADAIEQHYSKLVEKAGGTLVNKSESIVCSGEAADYHSGSGKGAVYKIKSNGKDAWLIVISKIEGNYKLVLIEP